MIFFYQIKPFRRLYILTIAKTVFTYISGTNMTTTTNKRRLVIGDVHGCKKTLNKLLLKKLKITKDDDIYIVGDMIDRGPDIKGTIELIMGLIDEGYNINCLMGNHEYMLLQSLYSQQNFKEWMACDGESTLKSFGVSHPQFLEQKYMEFFLNLKYYLILDKYILVHGGLNFKIDNPFEDTSAMVWSRNDKILSYKIGGRKLIVGHTPCKLDVIKASVKSTKVLLDGGCVYYKLEKGLGNLVAVDVDTKEVTAVKNCEEK